MYVITLQTCTKIALFRSIFEPKMHQMSFGGRERPPEALPFLPSRDGNEERVHGKVGKRRKLGKEKGSCEPTEVFTSGRL